MAPFKYVKKILKPPIAFSCHNIGEHILGRISQNVFIVSTHELKKKKLGSPKYFIHPLCQLLITHLENKRVHYMEVQIFLVTVY